MGKIIMSVVDFNEIATPKEGTVVLGINSSGEVLKKSEDGEITPLVGTSNIQVDNIDIRNEYKGDLQTVLTKIVTESALKKKEFTITATNTSKSAFELFTNTPESIALIESITFIYGDTGFDTVYTSYKAAINAGDRGNTDKLSSELLAYPFRMELIDLSLLYGDKTIQQIITKPVVKSYNSLYKVQINSSFFDMSTYLAAGRLPILLGKNGGEFGLRLNSTEYIKVTIAYEELKF